MLDSGAGCRAGSGGAATRWGKGGGRGTEGFGGGGEDSPALDSPEVLAGGLVWNRGQTRLAIKSSPPSKTMALKILFSPIAPLIRFICARHSDHEKQPLEFGHGNLRIVPLPLYEDDLLAKDVAAWYQHSDLRKQYPRLTASYIAVYLYLDYSPTDWQRTVLWGRPMVEKRPPGVVLIWDEINGTKNANAEMCVTYDELITSGWREIRQFRRGDRVWRAFASE